MRISCDREKLLSAFQTAGSVVPTRSPKPILQNVKLEVTSEAAILMSTDLEIGMRASVQGVQADVPGSAILPVDLAEDDLDRPPIGGVRRKETAPATYRPPGCMPF